MSLYDYYSRFDLAYPSISQYLAPAASCTYSLSPTSVTVPAAGTSGTFYVTASSGCAWTASSNASWLTTTSTGTSNGSVAYNVAQNSGVARGATITVGTQSFTVSQPAAPAFSSSLGRNLGFESGGFGWVESSTGGYTIVTNNPTLAHGGSHYGWLGGYTSGSDSIYQDVAIPADATEVSLRFWYFVATARPRRRSRTTRCRCSSRTR